MKKPSIIVVGTYAEAFMNELENAFDLHLYLPVDDKKRFLEEMTNEVRGIATYGALGASAEMIAALPKLEIISVFGVGYDAVDTDAAKEAGVIVTNTPDVLNDDVANLAVLLLLSCSRNFVQCHDFARSGRWASDGDFPLAYGVAGAKAGIIGLGRIGLNIAKKLEAFGMEIHWNGPRDKPDAPYPYHANLNEMAALCDYIIVACPGGEVTKHVVNADILHALGPDGTLINISRGSCVDEAALVAAIQGGQIRAAGLDVFEDEPNIPEALRISDRVTLQSHVGSATHQTRRAMGALCIENLKLHFAGEPVKTRVV